MIPDEVIDLINQEKIIPARVFPHSHFFEDLAFNSLAFIAFLLQVEKKYAITFDIMEIDLCLTVESLISLIETKVKEH